MTKIITGQRPVPEGFVQVERSAHFTANNGPFFEKIVDEHTIIRAFRAEKKHLNSMRFVHGGMLMTFADNALARAAIYGTGRYSVTIKMNSEFLSPAREGDWIEAHTDVIRRTKSVIFVRGDLKVGQKTVFKADALFHFVRAGR
ncbi:PaaI family thioesterase [Sneathiella sp.]|uniref:PaaI family thioesterase n=1 Tax=Sneathiella sp. TaxID=1964365 RepID=UPI003566480B